MNGQGAIGAPPLPKRQSSTTLKRGLSLSKKKPPLENGPAAGRKSRIDLRTGAGERTVRKLRLSKALTIPEGTTVLDACRRMAARRVDAALLTDSSALLCGIITDKDVATRVIAEGLKPEETPVSKVMTRNPIFVMSDTLAVDALQRMVQGKFRHLPVVENGEVVALLDITKCLYDAIARLERAAEKGDAIAAAVEGVERQWGGTVAAQSGFVEALREKLFRPSLGSIMQENMKVAVVSPSDTVYTATRKMQELRVNSVIIATNNKPQGILTSKDVLMRVVSQNQASDAIPVEKVMTHNPECATTDTTIVDALHIMHDGKFLHLPVTDRDGCVVACLDVLHLTHAAVATVGSSGGGSDTSSTMMQKFWDSAFALEPADDDDETHSDISATRHTDTSSSIKYPSLGLGNTFSFKLQDRKGWIHRFSCGTESLTELVSAIVQRVDDINLNEIPHILYEDDEGDHVLLATDNDLVAAVTYARACGWKGLRLHIDYSHIGGGIVSQPQSRNSTKSRSRSSGSDLEIAPKENWGSTYTAVAASAAVVFGLSMMMFLKRSNS